jgi:NADH-quinone oxidoreductase subunit H
VGADLDASALVPVVLLCNSALAFGWMAWSVRDPGARAACLRAGAQTLSYGVALALAMLPLLLLAGSLDLVVVAARQDGVIALARVAGGLSLPWPESGFVAHATLPAWGVIANPLAVGLVALAAFGASRLPPFDAVAAEAEARVSANAEASTERSGNAVLADAVQSWAIAGLLVTLGLGAWSIPWIDAASMAAAFSKMFGATIGTFACATVHVASFATKTACVWLLIRVAARRATPLDEDRMTFLCLRVLIPLALVNAFATGFWLIAQSGLA